MLTHLPHDDSKRTQFHDEKNRKISHTINRIYRSMKWDWAKILGTVPPPEQRQGLHRQIAEQVKAALQNPGWCTIEIDLGKLSWNPLQMPCHRVLQYRLAGSPTAIDQREPKRT